MTTAAFVGTVGGAGTTRLAVETATLLADGGVDVAVLDADYATQGLSDYLEGRLEPDMTALVTDDADEDLDSGLVDLGVDTPGRVACLPARAPFERLARAKTAEAAKRLEGRIAAAGEEFEAVLVDTPPITANQAVTAVTTTDRVALVAPGTVRGADGVQRQRARLADLGVEEDAVVATRGDLWDADGTVPESDTDVEAAPTVLDDGGLAAGIATVAEATLGVETDVDATEADGMLDGVRERL